MRDAVKRVFDVTVALLGGLALSPLMALVALAVLADSGRPVFFKQVRVGRHGKTFTVRKFRTMVSDPEKERLDMAVQAADPRITRVGRFLRASALDELPQLANVLAGDMSIVGPRPTVPEHVAGYDGHERRRLEVKPGLTGWAQVNGRNRLSWRERIEHDVWYVDHRCFGLDCRIVARTLGVILRPSLAWADGERVGDA